MTGRNRISSMTNIALAKVRTSGLNRSSRYSYEELILSDENTGKYTYDTIKPMIKIGTTISQYWVPKL